jgi:hypothetical protein
LSFKQKNNRPGGSEAALFVDVDMENKKTARVEPHFS